MNVLRGSRLFALISISLCLLFDGVHLLDHETKEVIGTRSDIHKVLSNVIRPDETIALLIDFDGTLAEINPKPFLTSIDPDSEKVLHSLVRHQNVFVAIISGRRVSDVRKRIGINNITYSGNHGMEVTFANQTEYHYPISPEIFANCTQLRKTLTEKLGINGAWVEDKNISLTYHYRDVPAELHDIYLLEARKLITAFGYIPVQAHYAIEIKPPVVWSKGDAAILILNETFGSDWFSKKVKVLFLGDDNSDEDVMRLLNGKGISFRVSTGPNIKTHADYIMNSIKSVTYLLEWIDNNDRFE